MCTWGIGLEVWAPLHLDLRFGEWGLRFRARVSMQVQTEASGALLRLSPQPCGQAAHSWVA